MHQRIRSVVRMAAPPGVLEEVPMTLIAVLFFVLYGFALGLIVGAVMW